MWRLPVILLKVFHMSLGAETEQPYCRRCYWTQNFGVLFILSLAIFAISTGGEHVLLYGLLGGLAVGLPVMAFVWLRDKYRLAKFRRHLAALSPEEREQVLAEIPTSERQRIWPG